MALNVIIATPEAVPFAKTGGLADVAGSLPRSLKALGCNVSIFMPLYRSVKEGGFKGESMDLQIPIPIGKRVIHVEVFRNEIHGIPVYFLKRDEFFDRSYLYGTPDGDYFDNLERFTFFSRGVLEAARALNIEPDVIHCNDWQTGLIPAYLSDTYRQSFPETGTLFTIHNIAYQGVFPSYLFNVTGLTDEVFNTEGIEFWGKLNLLKSGMVFSDIVSTVSEGYSREIQTPEYGCGLEGVLKKRKKDLHGVLNGVDYTEWNPRTDDLIPANFSERSLRGKGVCKKDVIKEYGLKLGRRTPLLGLISRLADQKGLDILARAMGDLIELDLGLVILGTGEKKYHRLFEKLARRWPDRLGVRTTFDNTLAHRVEAGCDIFLMPSRYEPCGLNQIYSLRYGTVPLVRATGGLDDTIKDYKKNEGNGFKFKEYSSKALVEKVKEALLVYKDKKAWQALQKRAMREEFSWERSAEKYMDLYREAAGRHKR
ncbi:MAG: glycogen synthase GlgA [Thermodesulfobacteriota bacterium]